MTRLPVEVRPLAEDEIGILEAKLRRYTSETHRDRFEEQERGETTYLVGWIRDQPAGYARIKWRTTFLMALALRDTPTIGDVTVREDLRSRGVGTQIMHAAEDLVRSRGFSRLALGVEIHNARAIDFYHRLGYFDAGIAPERTSTYLLGEGELWHEGDECICLAKDLYPGEAVLALARAKVNLVLQVGARRRDGFHSVQTVMQSVTLADEMTVRPGRGVSIRWAAGLQGRIPDAPDIVGKALRFGSRKSSKARARGAVVTKRIPVGAGLAGGSADGAAALRVLEFLDPVTFSEEVVLRQARRLGTDIAFCLRGGIAIGTGRGDRVKPIGSRARLWWVVGIPRFTLSTEEVYRRFDSLAPDGEDRSRPAPLSRLKRALAAGDLNAVAVQLHNDLEIAAFAIKPELAQLKKAMVAAGAEGAVMTGSGSAIAGLCGSEGEAVTVARKLGNIFPRVEVTAGTRTGADVAGLGG